jgi:acyl-CoA thioesterase
MSEFAADTEVVRAQDGWAGEITPRWAVGANPNGGYLVAIAARAMLADSGHPDPWTVTAHYLSPPKPGPVEVRTTVIKPGRTYSTVTAELHQLGRERVRVIGAFGDLSAREGPTRVGAAMPDIPPPEECRPIFDVAQDPRFTPEIVKRFEIRVPADTPWGRQRGDGPFELTGWIRFSDGSEPSVLSLLLMVDSWPPTLIGGLDVGWIPTVELTTHVRARPAPGWLLGSFRTRFLIDGLLEEDGELWDSQGQLVALSRQLALALPPGNASGALFPAGPGGGAGAT